MSITPEGKKTRVMKEFGTTKATTRVAEVTGCPFCPRAVATLDEALQKPTIGKTTTVAVAFSKMVPGHAATAGLCQRLKMTRRYSGP